MWLLKFIDCVLDFQIYILHSLQRSVKGKFCSVKIYEFKFECIFLHAYIKNHALIYIKILIKFSRKPNNNKINKKKIHLKLQLAENLLEMRSQRISIYYA